MRHQSAGWLALGSVALATASNASERLDLRPGFWEITLTVRSGGLPPVTPQAPRTGAARPQTTVKTACLDEKELSKPLMLTFGSEAQGCRQTIVEASRSRQEIRVDCGDGPTRGGGAIRIVALDRENAKVTSQWSAADETRKIETISTATLKWLRPICEVEFPGAARAAAAKPPAKLPQPEPAPTAATADAGHYYDLGKQQTGRNELAQALQSLTRAIELDPHRATPLNARGYVYLRMQRFADAAADFSEAIRLRADYANAYRNRAIARRHTGDQTGAAADSQRASELERQH